tara:strand:- start:138 stop:605 length:468 start_codon:yes stop_codon:yes gene_type:complete
MENLSQNKKISLGLGAAVLISLFLPWFSFMIFSTSLIGIPGLIADIGALGASPDFTFGQNLAIYIGYAFLIFGAAGLYFNYKDDIQKAKLSYYAMIGYFALVLLLNISDMGDMTGGDDGPSIFKVLGMGFYVFIASYIGNLKYLKEESESEIIEE